MVTLASDVTSDITSNMCKKIGDLEGITLVEQIDAGNHDICLKLEDNNSNINLIKQKFDVIEGAVASGSKTAIETVCDIETSIGCDPDRRSLQENIIKQSLLEDRNKRAI